jgi:hypothetical protein
VVVPGAANTPGRGTGLDARGTAGSTATLASTDRWTVVAGGVLQGEQGPAGRGSLDAYGRARRWRRKSSDTDAPPRSSPKARLSWSGTESCFAYATRVCCGLGLVLGGSPSRGLNDCLKAWLSWLLTVRTGDVIAPCQIAGKAAMQAPAVVAGAGPPAR